VSLVLKIYLSPNFQPLKHFAHFITSLNDYRSLQECFTNYELSNGNTFYKDPNAVNLPLAIIKTLHMVYKGFGDAGVKAALYLVDAF